MSFNGSGTFLINTAGQPVVAGTVISSTAFNALTADLATGLSTVITKDGQTTVTANIPMSTYKFTGLGVGSAATDSANLSQVQSTVTKLLTSVSGTDTITAVGAPVVAAYAAGQMFYFVATGDNTGAVTLNIDSLGAKAVTRDGSVALAAGDIKSGEVVVVVYDGTRFQVVSQLNSAGDARFANVSIASSLYVGGVSTFVGNAGFSANVSIASALSVGGVAAITGATTIGGNLTLNGGTANGVLYLNGSKVATSGSALTYNGSTFVAAGNVKVGPGAASNSAPLLINTANGTAANIQLFQDSQESWVMGIPASSTALTWANSGTEQMRLTSTGLGIGTSSPVGRVDSVSNASSAFTARASTTGANQTATVLNVYNSDASLFALAKYNAVQHIWGYSGATEGMRLDSSGNLGIGTTSPGAKLDVVTGTARWRITNDGSGNIVNEVLDSTGAAYRDYKLYGLNLISYTSGSERMRLDSSGNLGIGTSSPGARLDVSGNGIFTVANAAYATAFNASSGNLRIIPYVDANFGTNLTAYNAGYAGLGPLSFDASRLSFYTGSTERMRLDNSGNLGIGTSSPSFRLDVLTGVEGDSIRLNNNNANIGAANTFGFVVAESGSARVNLRYRRDGSGSAELYNVSNGPFVFGTNNTERARIDANGNIVAGASAALATTATNGFLYVPTCAGTPTGTPTAITGMAPIVVDTTNNKLYFYSTGVWRDAGP